MLRVDRVNDVRVDVGMCVVHVVPVDDVRVDRDDVRVDVGLRVVGVDHPLVLHRFPPFFSVSLHLFFFRSFPFCLPFSHHFAPFLSLIFVFKNIPGWIFWSSKACKNHCKRDNG